MKSYFFIRCCQCKTIIGTKPSDSFGITDSYCLRCVKALFPEVLEKIELEKIQENEQRITQKI